MGYLHNCYYRLVKQDTNDGGRSGHTVQIIRTVFRVGDGGGSNLPPRPPPDTQPDTLPDTDTDTDAGDTDNDTDSDDGDGGGGNATGGMQPPPASDGGTIGGTTGVGTTPSQPGPPSQLPDTLSSGADPGIALAETPIPEPQSLPDTALDTLGQANMFSAYCFICAVGNDINIQQVNNIAVGELKFQVFPQKPIN